MRELRFAILGTGFWSQVQLAAWRELDGARCVALYNRTRSKAEALAERCGVPAVYDDAEELLRTERLDFVDIITGVEPHAGLTRLAARAGVDVICQKPMAPDLQTAEGMVSACREAGVRLLIHENWRWQTPIRRFKALLGSAGTGRTFRARIDYCNSFPVFENQPSLRDVDQFILMDMGTHILDVARFLCGEAERVYCETRRMHHDIRGEDVATVVITMRSGATVVCTMSYASLLEREAFPQTSILVECERGSLELAAGYWIRSTTVAGTLSRRCPPPRYDWADPAYDVVQSSIVPCQQNLLAALRGEGVAETTGEDNVQTLRLVFAAYESARTGQVVAVG
jgi:predicted dehydrogenase